MSGAPGSAAKKMGRPLLDAGGAARQNLHVRVAAATRTAIAAHVAASGISAGQVVDRAVAALGWPPMPAEWSSDWIAVRDLVALPEEADERLGGMRLAISAWSPDYGAGRATGGGRRVLRDDGGGGEPIYEDDAPAEISEAQAGALLESCARDLLASWHQELI